MNKTAIKNFAVRARNKLIEDIVQKAYELGITKNEIKEIEILEGGFKVKGLDNSKIYKKYEINKREKLVSIINEKGFKQIVEEVAYTWFNRFIALRFMEINGYLPIGVRVLSSVEEGKAEPDIIKEALNVDLDIDKEIVYKLIDANETEDLYKYLLIKQCNELGKIMPMVFEEISDYTELLLPDNLLAEGSVIRDLVESVEEDDYRDQVEIIGWLYQYYISEKKDEVFSDLKKNKKITKENIPAATQLFTPKWIVKYMVENSLGRLWLESHPDEELQAQWKYYLEEAEQEPEVQKKLDELKDPNLNPEEIKVLDPAMGSGHILVYAFDVLYDIYLKSGYSERDIPQLILEKNLYGLDIDDRAGQLAAFALMMKARSKNRRIFREKIELNVCSIQESSSLIENEELEIDNSFWDYILGNIEGKEREKLKEDIEYLFNVFENAKEYGSILCIKKIDFNTIERRIEEIANGETVDLFELQYKEIALGNLPSLVKQGRIMSEEYDIVCINPPYMGLRNMNAKLKKYIDKNYGDVKRDLFSVFIAKCFSLTKKSGHLAFMSPFVWLFISSYTQLRELIIQEKGITSLIQLEYSGFDEATVPICTFTIRNTRTGETGEYIKLSEFVGSKIQPVKALEAINNPNVSYRYTTAMQEYNKIPNKPIAYWTSNAIRDIYYSEESLEEIAAPRVGLQTSDNKRFLRFWQEVDLSRIGFSFNNRTDAQGSNFKWFPYNKGGDYRKWYGNNDYVVNWENDGKEIREYNDFLNSTRSSNIGIANTQYYFKQSITWSFISSSKFGVRYSPAGFIFDTSGSSVFIDEENIYFLTAFLCSKLAFLFLQVQNPTLNFQPGNIGQLPVISPRDPEEKSTINNLVKSCIEISKRDWDSFETSWDFKRHPLLSGKSNTIEQAFKNQSEFTKEQFNKLKQNEEEINKIFIKIYGLQDELTPEVEDKEITIRKADRERDIKSFISYAVGCMFGRYSLDEEGLSYAPGELKANNTIPIVDDDYFEDDVVNRFVEFVRVTFGGKTLEENLDYIAETLGNKSGETSRQSIRRYFLKDFYDDHVKTYGRRPIYWLFDSGKQNGFKALIYMHCYDSSTVARVRTDYLHKLQKKYESEARRLDILVESDLSPREKAAAMKKKDSINKQIQECLSYDQVIAHVANQKIDIDLDDGVVANYEKFQAVQISQGEGKKMLKADLLAKI